MMCWGAHNSRLDDMLARRPISAPPSQFVRIVTTLLLLLKKHALVVNIYRGGGSRRYIGKTPFPLTCQLKNYSLSEYFVFCGLCLLDSGDMLMGSMPPAGKLPNNPPGASAMIYFGSINVTKTNRKHRPVKNLILAQKPFPTKAEGGPREKKIDKTRQ
ncbi:hypothetical protein JTE90_010730 [Oedothorax gibbosus]|uniref:Uncharacterized protein n=1 Tax=Oedothorax gibbosus TaxID=931172 RepID=A0AAV6UNC6_9ARAC|nr:hypothetical protein JTE90_010730 [Oedothorax gibbosus]